MRALRKSRIHEFILGAALLAVLTRNKGWLKAAAAVGRQQFKFTPLPARK